MAVVALPREGDASEEVDELEVFELFVRARRLGEVLRRGESRQRAVGAERRRVIVDLLDRGITCAEIGEELGIRGDSIQRLARGARQ